jgi:hypothetical protein
MLTTNFVRSPPEKGHSLLAPSRALLSHGRVFEGLTFPLRAAFFAWLATLEKILTKSNLRKQYSIVIGWCIMCRRKEESVGHLLLHCEVACTLWNAFLSCFGLS